MTETTETVITLKSKLAPPRLKDAVPRVRLHGLFDGIERHKAVTVTAGAGYGKTTFVAQACRARGLDTVWYRLDPTDGDVTVFVSYLIAAVGRCYDGFGHRTLQLMRQSAEPLQTEPQRICTLLLHELETCLDRHLLFVLDDFHLIQAHPGIRTVMQFLIEHLPHRLHFVLVSRSRPDLALSRLIAIREGFGITERDLAFTRAEIEALYREIFAIPLDDRALAVLEEKSGGWVTALILFHYRLKTRQGIPLGSQFSHLTGSADLFSNYLEENIYQLLPADMAAFLIRTAILPVLDVTLCNRLLEIENAGSIFQRLEKMHLFTFAIDDAADTYQYHHLFRDYLRARLNSICDPPAVARLHKRAGRLLAERGDIRNAIAHYFTARDYESAAALMVANGERLIESGQVNAYVRFSEKFPDHLVEKEPWLKFLLGYAFFTKGDNRASLAIIESARRMFEKKGDENGADRCRVHLATLYYLLDDFYGAETAFKQIIERVPRDSETCAHALGSLIFIASRLSKQDQAEAYYQLIKPALPKIDNPLAHAWVHIQYGFHCVAAEKYHEAIHHGQLAEAITEAQKTYNLVVLCCHVLAWAWWEMDEYEKSLAAALKGIRISEAYGFLNTGYTWCLIDATFSSQCLGRLSDALAFSRKGLQTHQRNQGDWTGGYAHLARSTALFHQGDLDGAEAEARQALITLERTPIATDRAKAQMCLAWVLLRKGRTDEARDVKPAADQFLAHTLRFRCSHLLFEACYATATGHPDEAGTWLQRFLELSPNLEKMHISPAAEWMIPLLVALHKEGLCRQRIEIVLPRISPAHLKDLDQAPPGPRAAVQTPLPGGGGAADTSQSLRGQCLGPFRLWRGDVELTARRWSSAKAKTLLKFLALHARRGYQPKDRLLELLWPDEDPDVTGNRLHMGAEERFAVLFIKRFPRIQQAVDPRQ